MSSPIIDTTIKTANTALSYDGIRMFLIIFMSVFVGYTLSPVPQWLDNIFKTSHVFKFLILVIVGLISVYPLTPKKVVYVVSFCFVTLVIFEYFRYLERENDSTQQ